MRWEPMRDLLCARQEVKVMEGLRELTEKEKEIVREFERTMEEEVIPDIVRVMEKRADIWWKRYGR